MRKPSRHGALSNRASRTYVEAFPRISIGAWLREASLGRSYLLWRDQRDRIAGAASLQRHDQASLVFAYCICDLVYEEESAGEQALRLKWKGSRADNRRPYAACPHCARDADTIVMVGTAWACGACHRLKNRSSKLRQEIRWSEEIATIQQRLDASMILLTSRRQRTDLEARRVELSTRLEGRRPHASLEYDVVLRPEYVAMTDVALCTLG